MRASLLTSALFAAAVLTAPSAQAYMVLPLTMKMATVGQGSTSRFVVKNDDGAPVDITVTPQRVDVDAAGKRTFSPEPGAFLVFPPQFTLGSSASQTISVRFVGDPKTAQGAIYSLLVEQTNVREAFSDGGSGIGLKQNFIVMTSVDPPSARATVRIENAPVIENGSATVTVRNDGPGVADLSALIWTITTKGVRSRAPAETISFGETRFVAPGATRTVRLERIEDGSDLTLSTR